MSEIIHANYTISGWLANLLPHSRPISDQSKIIGNLVVNVSPRLLQCFALWLVWFFVIGAEVALTLSINFPVWVTARSLKAFVHPKEPARLCCCFEIVRAFELGGFSLCARFNAISCR